VVAVAVIVDRATGAQEKVESEGLEYRSVFGLEELGLGS
jgi:orotate phosphoribosyltransferase